MAEHGEEFVLAAVLIAQLVIQAGRVGARGFEGFGKDAGATRLALRHYALGPGQRGVLLGCEKRGDKRHHPLELDQFGFLRFAADEDDRSHVPHDGERRSLCRRGQLDGAVTATVPGAPGKEGAPALAATNRLRHAGHRDQQAERGIARKEQQRPDAEPVRQRLGRDFAALARGERRDEFLRGDGGLAHAGRTQTTAVQLWNPPN